MTSIEFPSGVYVTAPISKEFSEILTFAALQFVANLHREFNSARIALLVKRGQRQASIHAGELPEFLPSTLRIRQAADWVVAPPPPDLEKRWVEITGPTDRKMMINALNSGANVFMADFEDANSPTWQNIIEGQINLRDAIDGIIEYVGPEGKHYKLGKQPAVLMVRPRGWHMWEKHVLIDDVPISASLFDFGLYIFHNASRLIEKDSGPYFYLPKIESHLEARLWNDVFLRAQELLGLSSGAIRATVLIETIMAAFEMEEILFELREHSAGLNAGRWDYMFSIIKKFRNQPDFFFPDRGQVTMIAPFMLAYTELLVRTCHKRGAHAIGGMAAYIPSRKDPLINDIALSKVREDKLRESRDGFDGTWVAHPDLVPIAMGVFEEFLGPQSHQKDRLREEVHVTAGELLDFRLPGTEITEAGLRLNINVALQYIESWLQGSGAVAIFNLMEDTATAEISRAQVWQWMHSPIAALNDGRKITTALFHTLLPEELEKIKNLFGEVRYQSGKFDLAAQIFDQLVTNNQFIDFLTSVTYPYLD